jgi:protein involved in polysaccharide export with SLBB domain
LDAISLAGGLTKDADPEMIRLRRETANSYHEKIVNIDRFLTEVGSTSPPEMVGPGYRIYVPKKRGDITMGKTAAAIRAVAAFFVDITVIYGFYRLIK